MPRLTPDDLAHLRDICAAMDTTTDHQEWLRKNRDFHQSLYRPAHSSFTLALLEQLSGRVGRYLHRWSETGVERNKEANAEHWAIVDAIEAGDLPRARRELQQHIAHTRDRISVDFAQTPAMASTRS
jgi:DNA-binding GntR family transcriptional regulator